VANKIFEQKLNAKYYPQSINSLFFSKAQRNNPLNIEMLGLIKEEEENENRSEFKGG